MDDDRVPLSRLRIIDLQRLERACEDYLDRIELGYRDLSDEEHYIYESAMKYIFGDDIFYWINERLK